MSTLTRLLARLALGVIVSGCTHGSARHAQRAQADLITRAEMERNEYASLYEVVQALRGQWLRTRGPTTILGRPSEVQVMVDDMRLGGVTTLRSLTRDNVDAIVLTGHAEGISRAVGGTERSVRRRPTHRGATSRHTRR